MIHDWKGMENFVVKCLEELIICDEVTREITFYCAFYERVKMEMH